MADFMIDEDEGDALLQDSSDRTGLGEDLSRRQGSTHRKEENPVLGVSLGRFRAYWLGSVVCMAGFLFGYDSGIVGGVLTFSSFQNDYHYNTSAKTQTESLAVGLQQLGAFVACFLVWPVTDLLGRNKTLMLSSLVFCIGAAIQTTNTHSLAAFYFARVIAGLGLGSATVVVPMYNSEMMPKELRGQVGSFFQLFFTFGIFTSYWIDYAVARGIPDSSSTQWQIPIGLQLIPAALLGLGMLTLPESARWLTKKGRHDEAWESLRWIRGEERSGASSVASVTEMDEIRAGVDRESRETEGFHLRELLEPNNFRLLATAFLVFAAQQATGATAFAYFGPQYFKLLLADDRNGDANGGGDLSLLLTGIFGAVKVVSCGVFVVWFSERLSRRQVLIGGTLVMGLCQLGTAAVVAAAAATSTSSSAPEAVSSGGGGGGITPAAAGTVALIYLFVVVYNFSWGPLPWPYVSEIFPARIREPGIATGVASQWLFNFIFSIATPYMIRNLAWATFLVWGAFDLVIAAVAGVYLRETQGLSLEEISSQSQSQGWEGRRVVVVAETTRATRPGRRMRRRSGSG